MHPIAVTLATDIVGLPVDDPRRIEQLVALQRTLAEQLDVTSVTTPSPGTKGGLQEIVLQMTSPEGLTFLAAVLNTWCSRDRDRSVEVVWEESEGRRSVKIDAHTVSDQTLRETTQRAIEKAWTDD